MSHPWRVSTPHRAGFRGGYAWVVDLPGFARGKVDATKVAQSFRLRALRYAETGGAAEPRDKMFHLAFCQMKLIRDRAEWRG